MSDCFFINTCEAGVEFDDTHFPRYFSLSRSVFYRRRLTPALCLVATCLRHNHEKNLHNSLSLPRSCVSQEDDEEEQHLAVPAVCACVLRPANGSPPSHLPMPNVQPVPPSNGACARRRSGRRCDRSFDEDEVSGVPVDSLSLRHVAVSLSLLPPRSWPSPSS